jgi:protein TonB
VAALLRLRLSDDARDEARALSRSVAGHAALVVVIAVSGLWHRGSDVMLMPRISARLVTDAPARKPAAAPVPRPTPPRPTPAEPESPPQPVVAAPEPEPERTPDPGVAPPRDPEPPPPKPKPKPREPERASAPAPASAPHRAEPDRPPAASAPASSAPPAVTQAATTGIAATVEGEGVAEGDPYLAHLVTRVSGRWSKPSAGLAPKSATIYFEIGRGGQLSGIRLEDPSGVSMFDRAALRAVELSNPAPPLPPSVKGAVLRVHFEFLP